MKKHVLLGLSALGLAVSALSAGAGPTVGGPVTITNGFLDNLSSYNTILWRKADWSNGLPFNCGFTEQNITHSNGVMKLELNNTPAPGKYYSCAEYQTKKEYGYGIYSARIKAARAEDGVVTGFFVHHGTCWGCPDHDEIDFEFLGKDPTQVQLNYFANGIGINGEHEKIIELGFDASSDYHTYTFDWRDYGILWFVDGILVHLVSLPWGGFGPSPTPPPSPNDSR